MSKEEKRKERAQRKRKIKAHMKHKEVHTKEKKRDQGVAMGGDRFEMKQVKKMEAQKEGKKKGEMKSSKFFKNLQDIVKGDQEKKDNKRKAKGDRKEMVSINNGSSKKFKM